MAEIFKFDKRFINVAVKETFIAKYPNWEAEATALGNIIFFKDTCEIWTLGTTYGVTPETMQEIADLRDDLDNLNLVTGFTDGKDGAIAATGATVVPIKGEGSASVTVDSNGIVINVPVVEGYKSGAAIEIDEDRQINLVLDETDPGNVSLEITENGLKASIELPEELSVASDDKVLKIDNNTISSTLSFTFDETNNKIVLAGKDGTEIGSVPTSKFVVDGILENVEIVEVTAEKPVESYEAGSTLLKFSWNTDGGSKVVYIPTADLTDIKANNVEIPTTIPVEGGPLATDAVKALYPNGIPANATIQDVLFKLFCEEKWPGAITTANASITSTMGKPTISMSTSTVEVGSIVEYSVASGKSSYSATGHKASGFTYGYAESVSGPKVSSNTSKEGGKGTVTVADGTISVTVTAPTGATATSGSKDATTVTEANTAGFVTVSGTYVAIEGNNKVTASNSSATYSCTFNALPVYYGVSNLGNTNNDGTTYPSTAKTETTKTSTSVSASETTGKTTPGAYKYFLGYGDYTAIDQLDSAKIRALTTKSDWITKDGTTTIVGGTAIKSNGKSIVIACPSKYKLSSVDHSTGSSLMDLFTVKGVQGTRTVKLAGGTGADHTYNVYIYPITNGAEVEFKNVSLVKA
jgi:hypothetical protein